jgi:hypothetical protein
MIKKIGEETTKTDTTIGTMETERGTEMIDAVRTIDLGTGAEIEEIAGAIDRSGTQQDFRFMESTV